MDGKLKLIKLQKKTVRLLMMLLALISVVFWYALPPAGLAFPVDPLPGDNLVQNPWFRGLQNPTESSLGGWTEDSGGNQFWSSSQKESNPSPDMIEAGVCGRRLAYCGTAARLSPTIGESGGIAVPGEDAKLYQVVQAVDRGRKLKFFMHWVSHRVDIAEVTIYGGDSPDGPWAEVWVPFSMTQDEVVRPPRGAGQEELWTQTEFLETVIEQTHRFYKIEFHANLPGGENSGFKFTGVYFATEETTEEPVVLTTPTELTVTENVLTTTEVAPPAETSAPESSASPTATETVIPLTEQNEDAADVEPVSTRSPWVGFFAGLLAGVVLVLAVFGGVLFLRGRKT